MPRPKKGIAGIKARKEKNENLARAGEKMQTDKLAQLEDQEWFRVEYIQET